MPFHERLIALKACKWVDEVIEKAPYDLTREFCDELFTKYNIDYIVHGDDPCIAIDGTDAYKYPKSLGKFKTIKRTEGISTTDIVGRMLVRTNTHHVSFDAAETDFEPTTPKDINKIDAGISEFLPTTRRIMQFGNNKAPKATDKIVYICGAFDLFNAGHIEALKKAKEFGDFLIVGVHTDRAVNQRRGAGFPILNLHERVLSVLQCRYADEVIIGAPWVITEDLIKSMNISLVVCGTVDESLASFSDEAAIAYAVPKKKGILQQFVSPLTLTVDDIMQRIIRNRDRFETRFTAKKAKEEKYYTEKAFVQEL
jgi:ethanolamine-phosphate cytidylyltransferase